jgi:hypothetical protein
MYILLYFKKMFSSKNFVHSSWVPVAHTCNPSFSGGRDQEDHGLKPARQIVHKTLSQKTQCKIRAGGVAQVVECLSSMLEVLVQTPVLPRKKKMAYREK